MADVTSCETALLLAGWKFKTENLSMPENLVITSGYNVRTDSGSRGKEISRVWKGVPDMYWLRSVLAQN